MHLGMDYGFVEKMQDSSEFVDYIQHLSQILVDVDSSLHYIKLTLRTQWI